LTGFPLKSFEVTDENFYQGGIGEHLRFWQQEITGFRNWLVKSMARMGRGFL
jgi:hypothetical protein